MSLELMRAHSQERARRRRRALLALKWLPVALAVLVLGASVLALGTASMGHSQEMAQQRANATVAEQDAAEAEQDLANTYARMLESASPVRADRLEQDAAAIETDLVKRVDADGVEVEGFEPVLVNIEGTEYVWLTTFDAVAGSQRARRAVLYSVPGPGEPPQVQAATPTKGATR